MPHSHISHIVNTLLPEMQQTLSASVQMADGASSGPNENNFDPANPNTEYAALASPEVATTIAAPSIDVTPV